MDIPGKPRGDNYAKISYHSIIGLVQHDVNKRRLCY
jgi:hypothetical protein